MAEQKGYNFLGLAIFSFCFLWSDNIWLIFQLGLLKTAEEAGCLVHAQWIGQAQRCSMERIYHSPSLVPHPSHVHYSERNRYEGQS